MTDKPKILHIGLCVKPKGQAPDGTQQAFMQHASEYKDINPGEPELNKKIIEMTKLWYPDIVFMQIQQAGKVHPTTINHLRSLGAFVLNWNGDIRETMPLWMEMIGSNVSMTCFSNMRDVAIMRGYGHRAEWLEIGYDPTIFTPEGCPMSGIRPVVFFGNNVHAYPMSALRYEMCRFLRYRYPNQFGEYGNGREAMGNFNSSQRDEAAAYRATKIAINVSHFEVEKYTSDRMYRILGTGTPICLAKWYPGIDDQFVDGYHLRTWKTLDELDRLIAYYLDPANEEERSRIAAQGNALAKQKYTFSAMVQNIINLSGYGK